MPIQWSIHPLTRRVFNLKDILKCRLFKIKITLKLWKAVYDFVQRQTTGPIWNKSNIKQAG